jgi:hypothetical protein
VTAGGGDLQGAFGVFLAAHLSDVDHGAWLVAIC